MYLLSFNTHGNLFLLYDLGPRSDISKGLGEEELCKSKTGQERQANKTTGHLLMAISFSIEFLVYWAWGTSEPL